MTFTAHQYWDERIKTAFSSRRNMYRDRAIGGASDTGVAVVQLVNTDGGLDSWSTDYSFAGRDAVLWMGTDEPGVTFADLLADPTKRRNYLAELTAYDIANETTTTIRLSSQGYSPTVTEAPSGYSEVFRGVVSEEPLAGLNEATLNLKDKQHLLDVSPTRPVYVGGEDGIKLGAAGRGSLGSASEVELTGDMACMVRVRADSLATANVFGWGGGTPAQYPWHLATVSTGAIRMRFTHSSGTAVTYTSTSTDMYEVGKWYLIGFQLDGDQLSFFSRNLDDPKASVSWEDPVTVAATTRDSNSGGTFAIGWSAAGFQGYVSEARVWDGAGGSDHRRLLEQRFIPNDIYGTDILKAGLGTIQGYWKCDEGSGTDLTDTSGNSNTLALAGTYTWDFPLGGGTDLAGKEMPLVFGVFKHFEPTLVDAGQLIFQVHPRTISSITEVLENGGEIEKDTTYGTSGDATSLANFLSATAGVDFTAGKFITYLAQGLIKLGANPSGAIRVSGLGDADGGYVNTVADIIERMVVDFGPLTSSDIDSTSFTAFSTAKSSAVNGLAIKAGDQTTLAKHVDHLLVGSRGWWIFDRSDGEMELGILTDPKTDTDTPIEIHDYHIARDGIVPERLAAPSYRQKVGYARTWSPLQREGLVGTAANNRIDELAEPYRWITISEDSIAVRHLSSEEPPEIGTTLTNRDDAYQEAIARQDLYGVEGRRLFRLKLTSAPDTFELGDLVKVYHPDRYSWSAGELFRVVSVDEGSMTIRIWG